MGFNNTKIDMKSIRETLELKELTPEEKERRGILGRLYGPCASIMIPTRNGRYYDEELWEEQFNKKDSIFKEMIANGGCPMELDHPVDREETCSEKIAAMMYEVPKKDENGHLICSCDIIDTPCGRIAYQLAKYGFKLGISSRGNGDTYTKSDGTEAVDPSTYELSTFDLVLVPAVKDARLALTESLDTKRKQLCESLSNELSKATPDEKKIMQEELDRLNINLNEEKEDKEEEKPELEISELSDEEKEEIKNRVIEQEEEKEEEKEDKENSLEDIPQEEISQEDEIPNEEVGEEPTPEEINPEETQNVDSDININDDVVDEEQPIEQEDSVDNNEETTLIDSVQKLTQLNNELQNAIKQIQSQLTVSNTKVDNLTEELNNYKSNSVRLSKLAKNSKLLSKQVNSLTEALNQKDLEIKQLNESKKLSLNEDLEKEYQVRVNELENLINYKDKQIYEFKGLVEKYRKENDSLYESYINSKAQSLNVDRETITESLNTKSISEIDKVCRTLRRDRKTFDSLPFRLNEGMTLQYRKPSKVAPIEDDDYIDDDFDEIAKL